jgi:hypothetical protein
MVRESCRGMSAPDIGEARGKGKALRELIVGQISRALQRSGSQNVRQVAGAVAMPGAGRRARGVGPCAPSQSRQKIHFDNHRFASDLQAAPVLAATTGPACDAAGAPALLTSAN